MSDRTRAPGPGARLAGADCACVSDDPHMCSVLRGHYLFGVEDASEVDECECTCHSNAEDDEEDRAHE